MATHTLQPANIRESTVVRALLKKNNVRWSALYQDGDTWLVRLHERSLTTADDMRTCPDWCVIASAAYGGITLVQIRLYT